MLGVLKALTRPINQAQLDAMADLAYHIGVPAFQGSTLVRYVETEATTWERECRK